MGGTTADVTGLTGHSSHPSFLHLALLVFEAVLQVICVSLPGYIAARRGMFDADAQKLVANLNVALFTPCLSTTSMHCESCVDAAMLTLQSSQSSGRSSRRRN